MNPYDPSLRKTIDKFKRKLKEQDFAGLLIAISKTHAEFRINFPEKWGALKIDNDQIRFISKKENYNSIEQQREAIVESLHIIYQLRDLLALNFNWINSMIEEAEKKFDIDHKSYSGFYPEEKKGD